MLRHLRARRRRNAPSGFSPARGESPRRQLLELGAGDRGGVAVAAVPGDRASPLPCQRHVAPLAEQLDVAVAEPAEDLVPHGDERDPYSRSRSGPARWRRPRCRRWRGTSRGRRSPGRCGPSIHSRRSTSWMECSSSVAGARRRRHPATSSRSGPGWGGTGRRGTRPPGPGRSPRRRASERIRWNTGRAPQHQPHLVDDARRGDGRRDLGRRSRSGPSGFSQNTALARSGDAPHERARAPTSRCRRRRHRWVDHLLDGSGGDRPELPGRRPRPAPRPGSKTAARRTASPDARTDLAWYRAMFPAPRNPSRTVTTGTVLRASLAPGRQRRRLAVCPSGARAGESAGRRRRERRDGR